MWRAGPASESACLDWSRSEMVDAPVRKSGRTTFRWDMLLRLGPFDWRAVAPLRAVRVAVGVIVPLACATQVVGAEGRSRTLRPCGCRWATGHACQSGKAADGHSSCALGGLTAETPNRYDR